MYAYTFMQARYKKILIYAQSHKEISACIPTRVPPYNQGCGYQRPRDQSNERRWNSRHNGEARKIVRSWSSTDARARTRAIRECEQQQYPGYYVDPEIERPSSRFSATTCQRADKDSFHCRECDTPSSFNPSRNNVDTRCGILVVRALAHWSWVSNSINGTVAKAIEEADRWIRIM